MRQLTEEETKTLFSKLANYTGRSLNNLIAPPSEDGVQADQMTFRLQKDRVFYLPLKLANLAVSIPRANLLSAGTMIGKFTKTGKFRLNLTALDVIAPHARYRVWIKQNGEMPFLYGGNVVKAHVGRWSEDAPEHSGVIVYSMDGMSPNSLPTPVDQDKTNCLFHIRYPSCKLKISLYFTDSRLILLFFFGDQGFGGMFFPCSFSISY